MADRVRIVDRGGHLAVVEDGRIAAAFHASDRIGAERWAAISRRFLAEAESGDGDRPVATPQPQEGEDGEPDRSRGRPFGGDGASTWPDWGRGWIWSPSGSEDPETLVN